jgi:pilus assembly protein Flp/PilA
MAAINQGGILMTTESQVMTGASLIAGVGGGEHNISRFLRALHNDESGQDLIEYALVAALIAFGAVGAMTSLTTSICSAFSMIGSTLKAKA